MSRLRIFADDNPNAPLQTTDCHVEIVAALDKIGVGFERWTPTHPVKPGDAPEQVMAAYREDIDRLVAAHGFQSVDVVSIAPDHPDRVALRAKFLDEHAHKENEVRFFVAGGGQFSLHVGDRVYEVVCETGDLISVPDGATHWFDMGEEPSFVAIRFFTEPDGWVGYFTGSDISRRFSRYQPVQAS